MTEEKNLMKDEIMLSEEPRKIGYNGNTAEEEIEDVNKYLG